MYPFLLQPQGPPYTNSGYYYQVWAAASGQPVTWSTNQEIVIQTFSFVSTACPVFEIAHDDFVINQINGDYYIDVNGNPTLTGILYNPSAQQQNPGTPGTITGPASVFCGQNAVAYSVASISNSAFYVWAYSGTGVTITGTANAVTLSYSSTATSGALNVYGANACGNGPVSAAFPVTVNSPTNVNLPEVTGPQSQTSCLGGSASFSVTAAGAQPFAYQWYSNAGIMNGQTAATLSLTNLQSAQVGPYWVAVSNLYGSVTSAVAQLTVNDACVDLCLYAGLNISGLPGRTYELRYTTDLNNTNFATWTLLATNTTPWFYVDTNSCGTARRFYGVKLQP
jgi:hypothetical protein